MTSVPTSNVDDLFAENAGEKRPAAKTAPPSFQRLVRRHYRAIAVAEIDPETLRSLAERPDLPIEDHRGTVVKNGRSALVVRNGLTAINGPIAIAYKRARAATWFKRVLRSLRTDRSLRSFRLGHAFLRLGIPTSRPLLALSPRFGVHILPTYLATEWIEDAVPLDTFLRRLSQLTDNHRRRALRETAARVGELVGRMHAHGIAHRDLKTANLLARERGDWVEVYVIDLDGVSRPPILFRQMRLTNLVRLLRATHVLKEVTLTARLRTLRAYLSRYPDGDWKRVWKRLARIFEVRQGRRGE